MAIEEVNNQEEEENDFFDYAGDILAAPFRGVEGALQGAYNLADYLAFDALPDYDTRFLGTSKTIAGGAVEGIAQFATGFVPFFGLASRAGALARAGTVAKSVVAGAATDFTVFNGQEARLSNLIQQVPELQNPVTEFLAHDEDEGELEGRLKNVLEGLGLEAVAGSFIAGLKAIKRGRRVREEGGSPDEQADVINDTLEGGKLLSDATKVGVEEEFTEVYFEPKSAKPAVETPTFNFKQAEVTEDARISRGNLPELNQLDDLRKHIGIEGDVKSMDDINKLMQDPANKDKLLKFLQDNPIEVSHNRALKEATGESFYEITDGNHRYELAKMAGIVDIPVSAKSAKEIGIDISGVSSAAQALSQKADLDRVGGVWESMSKTENLFRTPISDLTPRATEIQSVLSDMRIEGWDVEKLKADIKTPAGSQKNTYRIYKKDKPSNSITIFEDGNQITVDSQSAGRGGESVYQAILQYAYNKNKVYQPTSLSYINRVRTIGAMFSSALKNKSTKHFEIEQGQKQYFMLPDGYKWGENFQQDLKYLALAERNIVYDRMGRMLGADLGDDLARADANAVYSQAYATARNVITRDFNVIGNQIDDLLKDIKIDEEAVATEKRLLAEIAKKEKAGEYVDDWQKKLKEERLAKFSKELQDKQVQLQRLKRKAVPDEAQQVRNILKRELTDERLSAAGGTVYKQLLGEVERLSKSGEDVAVGIDEFIQSNLDKLDKPRTKREGKPLDLDDYEYDFEEDKFYKLDEEGAREVLDESGIRQILKEADPDFTAGVGETTFKRAVVTNTTLSYDPDQIGRRLGERVQLLEGGRGSLERVFPAPESRGLDEKLGQISPELKKDFYEKTLVEQVASRMQTNKPMTVREALADLNDRTNGNLGQYSPIVKKLLALGKDTGIDAKLEDRAFASNLPADLPRGSFYESGKRRVVFDGRSSMLQNNPVYTLLHEGTHAVTVDNVLKYFDAASFNKIDVNNIVSRAKAIDGVLKKNLPKPIAEMFRMFKKADAMRDDIVAAGADSDLYWIKNPAEFMSMAFSDLQLQQALKGIQYTPKMTLWEKIVNSVKSLFGKGVNTDLADNIISRVGEIAEMKLPTTRKATVEFSPELPKLTKGKEAEFLDAVPSKFRDYAEALLDPKTPEPKLPQFALETGDDVVVLKDLLEKFYEENPDKITVQGAITDVDTEIEQQFMLQQGKDAATKIAEARVVQQSLRDQAKGVIQNLTEAVDEYTKAGGGSAAVAKLKNNFQQLLNVADIYRQIGRETGITLQARREGFKARKIGLSQSDIEIEGLRNQFINASGGMHPDKLVKLIEETIDKGNPDSMIASMFKIAKQAQGKHFLDMPTEYWMNAILSGPKTQMVNIMGNGLTQLMSTLEAIAGGVVTGNMGLVKAVVASWADGQMISEAAKFAKKAFKQNDNLLDPQARAFSDRPQGSITGERIASGRLGGIVTERGLTSKKAFDAMGNFIRIPSRLLLTSDEFFKQLAYRRAARLKATMSGMQQGIKDPKQLAEYVNKTLDGIITEGGRMASEEGLAREAADIALAKKLEGVDRDKFILKYVKENFDKNKSALMQYAQDEAQYLTFTRDLQDKTLGKVLQEATNKLPMLRLVLPFVRTPTNLLKYAFERTPGIVVLREERQRLFEDLRSGDPVRRSQAVGKMMTSIAVAGVFIDTIYNNRDRITGGGPRDEKKKAALMATGWRPYSIKIGDTYFSYQRLDPLATLLGVGADLVEVGLNEPRAFDESGVERTFLALTLSITRNATNKSYLAGIQNFTDALSDPDRYMAKFGQNFTSSFVPNIISQMADYDTQALREVRSINDAFARKLGVRSGLDKKRNLLGEEYLAEQWMGTGFINPIAMSPVKDDAVLAEMASLNHAFRQPAPNLGGQIDMLAHENESGQTAYDRQLELLQSVKVQGETLRSALTRLVKSNQYQSLEALSEPGLPSPRVQKINRLLTRYRKEAKRQMLTEFPELSEQYARLTAARAGLKGGMQREDVLELLTQ